MRRSTLHSWGVIAPVIFLLPMDIISPLLKWVNGKMAASASRSLRA